MISFVFSGRVKISDLCEFYQNEKLVHLSFLLFMEKNLCIVIDRAGISLFMLAICGKYFLLPIFQST